jgi:hypothetical protein
MCVWGQVATSADTYSVPYGPNHLAQLAGLTQNQIRAVARL